MLTAQAYTALINDAPVAQRREVHRACKMRDLPSWPIHSLAATGEKISADYWRQCTLVKGQSSLSPVQPIALRPGMILEKFFVFPFSASAPPPHLSKDELSGD